VVGVVAVKALRAVLVALVCATCACSAPPDFVAVTHEYLLCIGRDPMRTLPLLTDGFHRRHGLHVATAAEARGQGGAGPGDLALDRYQLGWLAVQSQPEMARVFGTTRRFMAGRSQADGDRAWVALPIAPLDGPAFEQRFTLVRAGPDAPWRIDAIEQSGVVAENAAAAFAAYPNEAARRALAARPEGR